MSMRADCYSSSVPVRPWDAPQSALCSLGDGESETIQIGILRITPPVFKLAHSTAHLHSVLTIINSTHIYTHVAD